MCDGTGWVIEAARHGLEEVCSCPARVNAAESMLDRKVRRQVDKDWTETQVEARRGVEPSKARIEVEASTYRVLRLVEERSSRRPFRPPGAPFEVCGIPVFVAPPGCGLEPGEVRLYVRSPRWAR